VERLVEGAGIELKLHGADRIGHCPFHDDKTPSLVISPKKNLWHCLGACQTGGTVIDWVMKTQGVSFRHAVEILQDNQPLAAAPGKQYKVAQRSTTQKLESDFTSEADDQALMCQVIDYYHETLKESPEALDYLEQRGLRAAGLIETFKLGFANRTLGYRLPAKNRKAGAELRGQLQKIGLLRASGHEHFNGSLVIPVIDENGLVTRPKNAKNLASVAMLLAFTLACAQEMTFGERDSQATSVALSAILETPGRFDDSKVSTGGVLSVGFESTALFLTGEDLESFSTERAIWLQISIPGVTLDDLMSLDGEYVTTEGHFASGNTGHRGAYAAALEDVSYLRAGSGEAGN
jgi:hypothetical protein